MAERLPKKLLHHLLDAPWLTWFLLYYLYTVGLSSILCKCSFIVTVDVLSRDIAENILIPSSYNPVVFSLQFLLSSFIPEEIIKEKKRNSTSLPSESIQPQQLIYDWESSKEFKGKTFVMEIKYFSHLENPLLF